MLVSRWYHIFGWFTKSTDSFIVSAKVYVTPEKGAVWPDSSSFTRGFKYWNQTEGWSESWNDNTLIQMWSGSRNCCDWKAVSHVHITNGLIIYDLTKLLAPYPTQNRHGDGGSALPGDCVSDPSVEGAGGEGGRRRRGGGGGEGGAEGSPGITAALRDKRDIVALTDPSKKTLLPVPSAPAHPPHMSCSLPRTESPFFFFKHHLLLNTVEGWPYADTGTRTTVNYICGWNGIDLTNKDFNKK